MNSPRLDELIRRDENRTVSDRQTLEEIQLRRLNDLLERENRRKIKKTSCKSFLI